MKLTNFFFRFKIALFSLFLMTGCTNLADQQTIPLNAKNIETHVIPIKQAIQYTTKFRESRKRLNVTMSKDSFFVKNPLTLLNAEYFNRDAIMAMLNQVSSDGGIRVYLGQDKDGKIRLVMVPATKDKDIITQLSPRGGTRSGESSGAPPSQTEEAIERGYECPESCPTSSILLDPR